MKTILSIATLFCAIASAQSVAISDMSASGSPVALTGSVVFSTVAATQPAITLRGTNVSSKEIIALRAEFNGIDPMGFTSPVFYEHDNFFKPEGMNPGEQWHLIDPGQTVRQVPTPPAEYQGPPSAQAKVTFAQFSDGSTWGDSAVARQVLAERAKAKAFLEEVDSTKQDAKALAEILAKYRRNADSAGFLARQLLKVQAASGPSAVTGQIKERLSIGADREKKFVVNP